MILLERFGANIEKYFLEWRSSQKDDIDSAGPTS